MKKIIKIADIPIEINTVYNSFTDAFNEYKTDEVPMLSIGITEQDIINERKKVIDECAYEGVIYPEYSKEQLENTAVYRKIANELPLFDAFVFHGSAVAVDNNAYLFTAKSGTGKTTHTNLWLKNIKGSYVVNGDKPIIRIINEKPFVCGTPWMGKEGFGCNKIVPLNAICFLSRAKENSIEATNFAEVLPNLIGQSYRPMDGAMLIKSIKLLEKIGNNISFYRLFCNMSDNAALVAFKGMCK